MRPARAHLSYVFDLLILLALCLLFFWRVLTPRDVDRWIFKPGDFAVQHYYTSAYLTERLASGSLPLWQNYAYGGHPFVADIQNNTFYPLRLLNVLLHVGDGMTYRGLELEVFVHFLLVAGGAYLLARRLTGHRYGGLLAAITFTFSGYLTGYPPLQLTFLESQAWLPPILLFWEIAATRWSQGRLRSTGSWAVAAGLLWGVSILGGSAQSSLIMFYGVLAFALFRLWPLARTSRRNMATLLGLLVAFVAVGCGVAALQLLPTLEMLPLSARAGISFEEAGRGFTPYDLLQLLYPAVGGQFQALYVGILPLGLAALALLVVRRDPRTPPGSQRAITFWGWSGLVALLLSFGKHTSFFAVPYLLAPGWKLFREQERNIAWAVLAAALLAGYGMAWLCQHWRQAGAATPDAESAGDKAVQKRLLWAYGSAATATGVLALVFFVGYQAGKDPFWGFTSASLLMAVLLLLAIITLRQRQPALLLAVVVLDLFTLNGGRFAGPYLDSAMLPEALRSHPALVILLADQAQSNDIFRVVNDDVLPPNYGAIVGLEDVYGTSPLTLEGYRQWRQSLPLARSWLLLNVKYVITPQQALTMPADRLWEGQNADGAPIYLYRLAQPGPRAWFAGRAILQPNTEQALAQVAAPEFDPASEVVVSAIPPGFDSADKCEGSIIWRQRQPEHLSLEARVDHPCFLVLSELFYPGWRADVDGAATAILRADGVLRAIPLPAGSHQITFTFRPRSFYGGVLLTFLTLLLVLAWLISARLRPSQPPNAKHFAEHDG